MRKHALLTMALLLPGAMAFSAGYQLNLQGLRQLAMGGGGTAVPWDASTIFYNPGGLSRLDGFQAYGSVQLIIPRVQYVNEATGRSERTENQTFTPFNLYVGGTIKGVEGLGVGLGVYTPFGSGVSWADNWSGRYVIQNIELQSFFFQPTVSYRFNDAVSIGAGFVYAYGNVEVARALPIQYTSGLDGQAELDGNATGMGYNVGISLKAGEDWHFGISYRSRVDMHVKDGDATFTVPASAAPNFQNTSFDATLPLPEVLSIGVGWKAMEHLTLQADFNLVGWNAYDSLAFNYDKPVNGSNRTSAPRLYQNRLSARLGAHYQATGKLAFMLGGAYDPSPVRDGYVSPDLPDANRVVLTGGISYKPASKLTILAAIEYVSSDRRDSEYHEAGLVGRYQTKALTPGIGVTYDF
jgi:long-chain fatty acid transport protein